LGAVTTDGAIAAADDEDDDAIDETPSPDDSGAATAEADAAKAEGRVGGAGNDGTAGRDGAATTGGAASPSSTFGKVDGRESAAGAVKGAEETAPVVDPKAELGAASAELESLDGAETGSVCASVPFPAVLVPGEGSDTATGVIGAAVIA